MARTVRRISRRTMLRGAGGIAIALPWLEIMGPHREANAADGEFAKRFVTVFTPGGSVVDNGAGENRWRPTGTEMDFVLSPILSPLEPIKHKLLVVDGLDMVAGTIGERHQAGIIAWLTGTPQVVNADGYADGYARGPSIDQVLARQLSVNYPWPSVQMAVRWATGPARGLLHPFGAAHFEDNATFDPIAPRLDPQQIFDAFFTEFDATDTTAAERRRMRSQSILDHIDRRYEAVAVGLGTADRSKLEAHLDKIRDLERAIQTGLIPSAGCQIPARVDTSDYDPNRGLPSFDPPELILQTDAAIPKVGRFMMDMLVMALACELTPIASLQWTDTAAYHTFPWLDLTEHHHFYQHDGGFRPAELERIYTWYSEQHAYLLTAMDAVDMGGHSLLDESVVFFGSELAHPPNHSKQNMPFLLAGGGGGLRSGRFLRNENLVDNSHNNLLVSIFNLFGDERQSFGDPTYCTGPLPGLT